MRISDDWQRVEHFDLWSLLEDQGESDAPKHIESRHEPKMAECGRSLIGGMIEVQTVGRVKICGPCMRKRFG